MANDNLIRETLTPAHIIRAAEELVSEGISPTNENVRNRLGYGSYKTISEVLREWKSKGIQRAAITIEMPGEAKAAFERAGTDVWKIITSLATEKLTKLQADADEAIKNANSERDEALMEIGRLELIHNQKDAEIDILTNSKNSINQELSQALQRIHDLEIMLAEKATVETENKRLNDELANLHVENKELVNTQLDQSNRITVLETKLTAANQAALDAQTKSELERLSFVEQIEKLRDESRALDLQVEKQKINLEVSDSKANELLADLKDTRNKLNDKTGEVGSLSGELKATLAQNDKLNNRVSDLEKMLVKP